MVELFPNSGDPYQTPRSAVSDLGLHCLPITTLGVSTLQWVKQSRKNDCDTLLLCTVEMTIANRTFCELHRC